MASASYGVVSTSPVETAGVTYTTPPANRFQGEPTYDKFYVSSGSENATDIVSLSENSNYDISMESRAFTRHELMVERMFNACKAKGLFSEEDPLDLCAVSLRFGRDRYTVFPAPNDEFIEVVANFNVESAILLSNKSVRSSLELVPDANTTITMKDGSNLQVLESIDRLPRARKHQWAALLRQEGALIVWSEHVDDVLEILETIEKQLFSVVWSGLKQPEEADKFSPKEVDETLTPSHQRKRPYFFLTAVQSSLAIGVTIIFFGLGVKNLIVNSLTDGSWIRMALIALLPIQILFTQFVPTAAISSLFQIIGPVNQLFVNSVYYSGKPPPRLRSAILPHVTVQIAVYTESLDTVLDPTIQSVKRAITTYEKQGGTVSIYINDDGMQVISEAEAQKRKEYYANHSIGWCSRPKHGKDGFVRKGRFKKASNLNFCLMISRKVEELIAQGVEYEKALSQVVTEDGRAWAGGNILIGDYILQLDADTRVPEDCFLDAVSEMVESPEVAILQFSAGVMFVVHNYWEHGIAHFTDIIYAAIRYVCGSGEVSPFVGHNAMLRWSAMQEVAFEEEGAIKYWSESHVSEDFDMSLRLQIRGYIIRYASYQGDGFQEGVSLTVYDEVKRWQKYAYGCSELVFNPIWTWIYKGPFTRLFLRFLTSNMNLSSKINIVGYIGSYYAIGAAWPLTIANYFLVGYWADSLDQYYLISFNVLITSFCVFTILSTISFTIFNYRIKTVGLFKGFLINLMWIPFFIIFFSGLSFHVSLALVAHLFSYNMSWSTTSKEVENSNFFKEIPKIVKGFKINYILFTLLTAMLPILAYVPPAEWKITGVTTILPCALIFGGHLLLPIVLNPYLMFFSF